ncbi:regulator of sirC expression with transglutaminase-like and TPR domain [Catalinimonas alkaloidigena]|uniref:transglutaminase-like domain-containing protein n=1 Tax=Catalinimonas alkaloidigena TaxID=1075417 RepID=UPI0024056BDD|nr:transglutaminase-like domain-containing protein [Catalinimonas alkaloidigena]MDF9801017.1 regulator of sirC expression with transglutaminase-like and TPR domain [Catalinimonas alkaloidigena]
MDNKELKALVSLLDDEDQEVLGHVEEKIISFGDIIIPFLEEEWENSFNPNVQKRIEDIIHILQFEALKKRLEEWFKSEKQDMLEGMWIIATYQYPDLTLEDLKKQLEQIYYEAWLEFKTDVHPFDQVKILNSVLFSKLKFSANTKNFHAPANSMINTVLETKKGNPISLCVIYMLVAQRLKLPVYGVNLPSLFILTYKSKETQFYINAFNRGLIFSKNDIDNYIAQLKLQPIDIFYQPCSNLDIVRRMFRNLIVSFEKLGDYDKAEEIKILLEIIFSENDPGLSI